MIPRPPELHRRVVAVAALVGLAALLLAPGCGRLTRHFSGGGGPPSRKGSLTAAPASGPIGTAFSLTAGGFRPGEPMTFEIDIPSHPRFVGPSHTAAPDGTVTSTYTPLKGDPPGTYQIKAVGSLGTRAETALIVTG